MRQLGTTMISILSAVSCDYDDMQLFREGGQLKDGSLELAIFVILLTSPYRLHLAL